MEDQMASLQTKLNTATSVFSVQNTSIVAEKSSKARIVHCVHRIIHDSLQTYFRRRDWIGNRRLNRRSRVTDVLLTFVSIRIQECKRNLGKFRCKITFEQSLTNHIAETTPAGIT